MTLLVAANVITEAIIGPTHGVQISPRLTPNNNPLQKPFPFGVLPETLEASLVNNFSMSTWKLGKSKVAPKRRIITTEIFRKISAEIPVARTIADKNSVKSVKLRTKPVTMPIGLLCPPFIDPDNTTGSIGRMHGESIVTKPAIKEKNTSKIMLVNIFYYFR